MSLLDKLSNLTTKNKTVKSKKTRDKSEAMDTLLKENPELKLPQIGELIEGKIISVSKNEVHLDINGLVSGVVRGKEIYDESGDLNHLKIGDTVIATVLELENEFGELELSFRSAGHQRAWDTIKDLMNKGEIVDAKVIDANRGGLMIKVGNIIGFMPVSQLSTEHYPRVEGGDKNKILSHLKGFVGQALKTKIIDANENDDKLIVSEKAAFEEKQIGLISQYKVGDVVEGVITGVVDFGAFVEFGDKLEGLIHISELAWQRIDNPRDIIKVGDKIKAEIIEIAGSKISLSMKKLSTDPWQNVEKKYQVGQTVSGKILKINPFGAFVELDKDIHGLVHISELENEEKKTKPSLEIDKIYDFKIITIEPNEHRLGLSLKNSKNQITDEKPKADGKKEKTKKPTKNQESAEKI